MYAHPIRSDNRLLFWERHSGDPCWNNNDNKKKKPWLDITNNCSYWLKIDDCVLWLWLMGIRFILFGYEVNLFFSLFIIKPQNQQLGGRRDFLSLHFRNDKLSVCRGLCKSQLVSSGLLNSETGQFGTNNPGRFRLTKPFSQIHVHAVFKKDTVVSLSWCLCFTVSYTETIWLLSHYKQEGEI